MEKEDILVSQITYPSLLPAMKKAGAIITNVGGVICHAAIIARELNIPCIVGTKFATKVLKDGDLVEVDADTGVVRILETNEIKNTPIMTLERKEDNYEIKIKDKIYTPEVWKETPICCTYNGFPFFTSVFVKSAIFQETEWTTPHNYLLSFTSEGTIIQYVASNLIDKGHNAIKNILEHKQNYFHFFNQTHQQILDCIKECEIYLKNNKNNFQEIWSLIQDVLSNAQNIFNFSYALQGYLENVRKQNEELYI
jgi:phosphohistidine swiveling domain-containing protein